MCDPVSLAVVAIGSTVLGSVQQAGAQKAAGKANAEAAEFQAQIAANNQAVALRNAEATRRNKEVAERNRLGALEAADLADMSAQDALDRGAVAITNNAEATKKLIGRQRAVLAANGVLVDSGSALDIVSETAGIGALDQLTIRSNADREALGLRQQARNYRTTAKNFATEGENIETTAQNFETEAGNFGIERTAKTSAASYSRKAGSAAATQTMISGIGNVATKWYAFNSGTTGSGSSGRDPNSLSLF